MSACATVDTSNSDASAECKPGSHKFTWTTCRPVSRSQLADSIPKSNLLLAQGLNTTHAHAHLGRLQAKMQINFSSQALDINIKGACAKAAIGAPRRFASFQQFGAFEISNVQ